MGPVFWKGRIRAFQWHGTGADRTAGSVAIPSASLAAYKLHRLSCSKFVSLEAIQMFDHFLAAMILTPQAKRERERERDARVVQIEFCAVTNMPEQVRTGLATCKKSGAPLF